jgi:hypothetical protein
MGIAGIGVGVAILTPPNRRNRHARGGADQRVLEKIPTSALRGTHLTDLENLRGLSRILPASDFSDPVVVFLVSHDFYLRRLVSRAEYRIPGSFASDLRSPRT